MNVSLLGVEMCYNECAISVLRVTPAGGKWLLYGPAVKTAFQGKKKLLLPTIFLIAQSNLTSSPQFVTASHRCQFILDDPVR